MDNITCEFVKKCSICDVPTIVQTVALHLEILNSKAELDQLSEGMSDLGVLDEKHQTSSFHFLPALEQ